MLRMAALRHHKHKTTSILLAWGPAQCLSELLLCQMRVLWCLGSWGLFMVFLTSSHRASISVNVKVTMSGTEWIVSLSSCRSTVAYRTTDSATQMPTVQTFTSRVSVAATWGQRAHLFRLVCREKRKIKQNETETKEPTLSRPSETGGSPHSGPRRLHLVGSKDPLGVSLSHEHSLELNLERADWCG